MSGWGSAGGPGRSERYLGRPVRGVRISLETVKNETLQTTFRSLRKSVDLFILGIFDLSPGFS